MANLAVAALERGDLVRALALSQESLSLYEGLRARSGVALALINLGDVARERDDEGRALALYNDAFDLYQELGNERGVARALDRLSEPASGGPVRRCPKAIRPETTPRPSLGRSEASALIGTGGSTVNSTRRSLSNLNGKE